MRIKLATLLLIVSLLSIGIVQSQSQNQPQPPTPAEGQPVQICTVSAIPYGFVITSKITTDQCRSNVDLPDRDNTWVIKKPGQREVICEKSSYPNNYAVVARTRLNGCPNYGDENVNNAWVIERLK